MSRLLASGGRARSARRPPVHGRPVHRGSGCTRLRHSGRPDAGRVPRRRDRRRAAGAGRPRGRARAAAARRHRPRSSRRSCASAGADVDDVVAYRTIAATPDREGEPDIYRMLLDRQIDAVTFASASAVSNFVEMLGARARRPICCATVGGVDRAGHGGSRAAARHRDDRHAAAVHDSRSRRRARRALHPDRRTGPDMTIKTHPDIARGGATARRPRWARRVPAPAAAAPADDRRRSARSSARRGLSPDIFIYPLFVCPGEGQRREVGSMPGVFQFSVDEAVREAAAAKAEGIPGVLLFGLPDEKDAVGSGAYDPEAPVQAAIRAIKREVPGLLVVTDVCLCEYTSTATAASSSTKRSSTIRPSSSSCAPRSRTRRRAPTWSRRPT